MICSLRLNTSQFSAYYFFEYRLLLCGWKSSSNRPIRIIGCLLRLQKSISLIHKLKVDHVLSNSRQLEESGFAF